MIKSKWTIKNIWSFKLTYTKDITEQIKPSPNK